MLAIVAWAHDVRLLRWSVMLPAPAGNALVPYAAAAAAAATAATALVGDSGDDDGETDPPAPLADEEVLK
jgi:hypothetical protein